MKANYLRISMFAFAASALFAACSQDEVMDSPAAQQSLAISATQQGFESVDPQTRVAEDGYATKFENGDQMGLFVIENVGADNARIILRNVPMTYDGTKWTTESPVYFYENSDYIAYFPYDAALSVTKVTTNELKDEITTAFSSKLTNQTTIEEYRKADLMMASVSASSLSLQTESTKKLAFQLKHAFSMIEVQVPVYNFFYKDRANQDVDFSVPMQNMTLNLNGAAFSPLHIGNGVYRKLIVAGQEIKAGKDGFNGEFYDPKDYKPVKFESSSAAAAVLPAGNYKKFNVTMAGHSSAKAERNIIGDYFCQDGSIYPGDFSSSCLPKNIVGVVYADVKDGDFTGDNANKYSYYVVALQGMSSTNFSGNQLDITGLGNNGDNSSTDAFSPVLSDMLGYDHTQIVKTNADQKIWTKINEKYVADPTYKLSASTSGWFIPSAGQLFRLTELMGFASVESFSKSMNGTKFQLTADDATGLSKLVDKHKNASTNQGLSSKPSDYDFTQLIWTSTQMVKEGDETNGFTSCVCCLQIQTTSPNKLLISIEKMNKTAGRYVRPILAF